MGFLFGKRASSTSESGNTAYPFLQQQFGGLTGAAGQGGNALAALLGVGGDPAAADAAFKNYRDSSGFDFLLDTGSRAITGSQAAKGLLKSGSTLKRLEQYGQDLASTKFDNYLARLMGLSGLGLQAGQLLGGAGQYSKGISKGPSEGLAGPLGSLLSSASAFAWSDRRVKDDIKRVGELDDGQNVYRFRYKGSPQWQIGLMAQEVEKVRPEAVFEHPSGVKMVNYLAATRRAA